MSALKMKNICHFYFLFLFIVIAQGAVHAEGPYTPPPGTLERKAIMEALREGLKRFPDSYSLDFKYKREDVHVPPDIKIRFLVAHLQIKDGWAWVEAEVENYCCASICALLAKKQGKWEIMGLVNPNYVVCAGKREECIDAKNYIYQEFRRKFPAVPSEIFPQIIAERYEVLKALRDIPTIQQMKDIIFVVNYLRIQENWAWIETSPRNYDGGQFEPVEALLHKEKGKWIIKQVRPCCGECADDPECADIRRYYKKLIKEFSFAPKEISLSELKELVLSKSKASSFDRLRMTKSLSW